MNLLEHIRHKRTRKRKKQPFERKLFTQISALVRWYGLDENFLKKLDHVEAYPSVREMDFIRAKTKKPVDFPLFSLCSRDEYDLTRAILRKVTNPYVSFAHSPEEILLSGTLYGMNAELRPEALRRYDFKTLLLYLEDSANPEGKIGKTIDTRYETEYIEDEKSPCDAFTEHIKMLHNFVEKIENTVS
jgi:hypothetical protein